MQLVNIDVLFQAFKTLRHQVSTIYLKAQLYLIRADLVSTVCNISQGENVKPDIHFKANKKLQVKNLFESVLEIL